MELLKLCTGPIAVSDNTINDGLLDHTKPIKMNTIGGRKMKYWPKFFEFEVGGVQRTLTFQSILGGGANGEVAYYNEGERKYAVKRTDVKGEEEVSVASLAGDCKSVPCRLLYKETVYIEYPVSSQSFPQEIFFNIMPMMSGDLSDLYEHIVKLYPEPQYYSTVFEICENVRQQLVCMYTATTCSYLDVKLENILYKCTTSKLSIFVGDLGSIELPTPNSGRCFSVSTYPPPEADIGGIFEVLDEQRYSMLAWQIGVLFYLLTPTQLKCSVGDCKKDPLCFGHTHRKSEFKKSDAYKSAQLHTQQVFGVNIATLLSEDPDQRLDIRQILPWEEKKDHSSGSKGGEYLESRTSGVTSSQATSISQPGTKKRKRSATPKTNLKTKGDKTAQKKLLMKRGTTTQTKSPTEIGLTPNQMGSSLLVRKFRHLHL
jgi:hypothetical protein